MDILILQRLEKLLILSESRHTIRFVNTWKSDLWKPNVTVAAIAEDKGRFLLVEEETADGLRLNQPAGHLDERESLVAACVRETLEETAYAFAPTELVGIYQWPRPVKDNAPCITYLRFAFAGKVGARETGRALDAGIVRALWMTPQEIEASVDRHRSPLVLQCVRDYLGGRRYPIELICHYD